MVSKNSPKAWLLASRPKTLTGAAAPVILGSAMAWRDIKCEAWMAMESVVGSVNDSQAFLSGRFVMFTVPALLCLLFAFLMQVDANFVNDWWDFCKGTDREDRLGPERACAQGWISSRAMLAGITVTTVLACLVGLVLLMWRMQWELLWVGIACLLGCFLYTLKLSYLGLGDLLVVVFFGLVPVCFTYYVIVGGMWPGSVTLAGLGMGLITDNLLIVNNYRDVEQDRVSGKKTLVVRFGKSFAERQYLFNGVFAAMLLSACGLHIAYPCIFVFVVFGTWHLYGKMRSLTGKSLNSILGKTALLIFLYGVFGAMLALIS